MGGLHISTWGLGLLATTVLTLASGAVAQGPPSMVAQGQELITLSGRDSMHELTLNSQVATSVTFPSDITLVTGYGLVLDAAHAQELIDAEALAAATLKDLAPQPVMVVHYAQASKDTLVMRAIRRGTPCYLTVRCGTKFFLFKCNYGDKANIAVIVLDKGVGDGTAVEVKKADILKSRTNYSSTELLGILSRAKQREFLESVNPDLFDGWSQRRDLNLVSGNGELTGVITEIQQWPQRDALVFRCRVENKSTREVRFKPGDVKVRAGDASYGVQLADSGGVVQPGGSALLDVVLQGNAGGGQEHLSIKNDFKLEIPEDRGPPPPNDLIPPPNPLLPAVEGPGGALMPIPEGEPGPILVPLPTSSPSGKETRQPQPERKYRHPLPNLYPNK